MLIHNEGAP